MISPRAPKKIKEQILKDEKTMNGQRQKDKHWDKSRT